MERPEPAVISRLLSEAKVEHIVYETEVLEGVYDKDWPQWYASYLMEHGLPGLFAGVVTPAELGARLPDYLSEADEKHRADAPAEHWPDYYARFLIATIHGDNASNVPGY